MPKTNLVGERMKKIKKTISKILNSMPGPLRKKWTRKNIFVDQNLIIDEQIIFKVADTEDELQEAFGLVQQMYESANIVEKNTTGLRITKYHLLPTTKVLIAKQNEKVIATISLIMDTPVGLPIDEFIPLGKLRTTSKRICELSSLAISSEWRSQSQGIFIPLSLFGINFGRKIIGADNIVIVTNDRVRFLYEDVFLFEPITINSQSYNFVKDSKAFAQRLDLSDIEQRGAIAYKGLKDSSNVYKMLIDPPWEKNIFYSRERFDIVTTNYYSESIIENLFIKRGILKELKESEKQAVHNVYSFYKEQIGENLYIKQRRFPRFYANMSATLIDGNNELELSCVEISKGGCALSGTSDFKPKDEQVYTIKIELNEETSCEISAQVVWTNKNTVGFQTMIDKVEQWFCYLDEIEQGCKQFVLAS